MIRLIFLRLSPFLLILPFVACGDNNGSKEDQSLCMGCCDYDRVITQLETGGEEDGGCILPDSLPERDRDTFQVMVELYLGEYDSEDGRHLTVSCPESGSLVSPSPNEQQMYGSECTSFFLPFTANEDGEIGYAYAWETFFQTSVSQVKGEHALHWGGNEPFQPTPEGLPSDQRFPFSLELKRDNISDPWTYTEHISGSENIIWVKR